MNHSENTSRLLYLVMSAVLLWGTILAIGAFLFGIDQERGGVHFAPNPLRGAIVFLFVIGFVGLWWMLVRRQPVGHSADSDELPNDDE